MDHFLNRDTFILPTYPLRHRMLRLIWGVVYISLFRFSPRPFFAWRRFLLRLFGANLGLRAKVYSSARIWAPWNVVMGTDSCIGPDVDVYSMALIELGDRSIVSQRSFLCCGSHNIYSPCFELITAPIRVGSNSWIAAEAFVGPGVTLGENVVVAARACVTKDAPANSILAGIPARQIGIRSIKGNF